MSGNQRTTARHKEALCHNHREKGGHRREKLPRHRRLSSRDMGGTRDCWDHTASVVHHRTPRGSKIREAFSFCVTIRWHFCDRISGLKVVVKDGRICARSVLKRQAGHVI